MSESSDCKNAAAPGTGEPNRSTNCSTKCSIRRELTRTTLVSFFKVIGFITGITVAVIALGALFSSSAPPRVTSADVLPNHDWKIKAFSTSAPTILQIDIKGVIGLSRKVTGDEIRRLLAESQDGDLKSGQVKAILLNIDTPGGTVDDSNQIYQLLKEYKARFNTPIIAYVPGMCASGGMYIACAADKIYGASTSITGSVGVIMGPAFNVSKLMEKVGIEAATLTAGEGKDELNPFRPWRPDEEETIQNVVDAGYQCFVDIVAKARPKLTKETLIDIGAGVFPADQALEKGYIDGINDSYFAVIEHLANSLGIQESYQLVSLQKSSLLGELFSPEADVKAVLQSHRTHQHYIRLPGDIAPELVGKPLYLYHTSHNS